MSASGAGYRRSVELLRPPWMPCVQGQTPVDRNVRRCHVWKGAAFGGIDKNKIALGVERRVKVGNNMFYLVTGSEGATGHIIETRTYRTFHDGRCYQFDLALNKGNMSFYDKGTVRAVNDRKVFANLEASVRSLYF